MTTTMQRSFLVEQGTVDQAREAAQRIERRAALAVVPDGGQPVALPRELAALLEKIIATVSAGATVTVGAVPEELTTTEAAAQLGVSRTTLLKMVARGDIAAHKVGSHTRLRAKDVIAFRESQRAQRLAALAALRELDDEAGLDT
ncbi:hypothetical protein EB74_03255 [Mycobacterium sp. SWH-M5]|uniref:helix-turn-helix domain-containing protein n=1 Tax=Mycolicibacterium goodii TaxID=134601 RepID=UPI00093A9247|nr:helix-turn-helix domain-containing protein [Mycolicibacterium goodii]MBU8817548.1 helix-turn-helix domain-containing protein [Mycolicibacterium goodii]OKH66797.1 hypothetical protein EB74_03255 [Mycobacterium sp. SWH-M5]